MIIVIGIILVVCFFSLRPMANAWVKHVTPKIKK